MHGDRFIASFCFSKVVIFFSDSTIVNHTCFTSILGFVPLFPTPKKQI